MSYMTDAEVLNLIEKRKKATKKWNDKVVPRSKGAKERHETNYIYGTVTSERTKRESVFIVLDGLCSKFFRKHRDVLGVPRNRRARYMRDGIPFNSEMTK